MLLYNGHLLPEAEFALPLPNRGLYFNDGFFETLVWSHDQIRYAPHHLARLQRAATALGLELPAALTTEAALAATISLLVATAPPSGTGYRIRLQLWRGGGGLYSPATNAAEWLMTQQPFQAVTGTIRHSALAESVHTQASAVSFCKGPNALLYVLAAQERQRRQLDELILLSKEGYVAEAVAASVAWIRGNTVYTPDVATGCVAGARLRHLQEAARQAGLHWHTGLFGPEELLAAEAVFTANIAGIRAILRLNATDFASEHHPLLLQLRALESHDLLT
ncbi:aminotransferase class IV [Hymenobacter metallilatus]|uniref:Aminotransferase IV n=1 Tax=Hymenobacter metallilatus TaxID=2493666 RepID=A0A428JK05_9BACT|nr:aminotransferase class IV [Hymenobacter metallilatus]RSK33129.1 hypothetical protein EI290_10460 [Hymenobacter metallilatus]